jgi:hypothetical protein
MVYCARGESPGNRTKEQQVDLFADRTSTSRMWSNQLRLYFSSLAYVLLQTLRRAGTGGYRTGERNAELFGGNCSRSARKSG